MCTGPWSARADRAGRRRRKRKDYRRWERGTAMELWQMDVTASAFLTGGTEVKIVTGKTATLICENNHFRVLIEGATAVVVPRTTTSEVHRYKANATDNRSRPIPEGQ